MKDVDDLIKRIRNLPSEALSRVSEVVATLEKAGAAPGRFSSVCGGISPADAAAMKRAVEDCEQVDPRGWCEPALND
jgi:hypothetical protein